MKQNLLFFALGLLLTIAISSTTISMMTIKPAQPKSTVILYERPEDAKYRILEYVKLGFIVKSSILAMNGSGVRMVFVVMERY